MAKFDKEFNERLHDVFSNIGINQDFTLPEFRDLVFGSRYRSKKKKKVASDFLKTRRAAGEIVATDMKRGHATTGRKLLVVYEKKSHAGDYKTIPMSTVPDSYFDFIPIWNTITQGQWITTQDFNDMLPSEIKAAMDAKDVSNFLWMLSDKGYANKRAYTPKLNQYQKVIVVDVEEFKSKCKKFFKKRVGVKVGSQPIKAAPAKAVISVDPIIEANRPTIDPNNVSPLVFGDAIVKTLLARKKMVEDLQAKVAQYEATEERYRKNSISKVDDLNKQVCVMKREQAALERQIKNQESTIMNLRRAMEEKRNLVLELRQQLEEANKKVEEYENDFPIKLTDIVDL